MPSIETSTPRKSVLGRVLQRMERRATASRLSVGRPSEPLLGLPLKRLVPQDIHTANDHAVTLANVIAARCANSTDARAVALALAGSALVVNLLTDYRLSLARLIPIEVHEGFDHLWGATNILAPFLLGSVRKSPLGRRHPDLHRGGDHPRVTLHRLPCRDRREVGRRVAAELGGPRSASPSIG